MPWTLGDRQVAYRTIQGSGRVGCGYIPKPDPHKVQTEFLNVDYSVLLLLSGEGVYSDEKHGTIALSPGHLVHRTPGLKHHTIPKAGSGWYEFFILLPATCYSTLCSFGMLPGPSPVWRVGLAPDLVTEITSLLPALRNANNIGYGKICLSALSWIGHAAEATRSRTTVADERLSKVCALLGGDLSRDIDLQLLSMDLGMSYPAFRAWFKKSIGCGPNAYRLSSRIARAQDLLSLSDKTIDYIARETGFYDRYAFGRAFRKLTGDPPAEFRRKHGQETGS